MTPVVQPASGNFFTFLISLLLGLILLSSTASASSPHPPRCTPLPLFRAPNTSELASASAAKAPIVWSAHQPTDSLLVIADGSAIGLACLFDGDSDSADPLELSWSIEDVSTGLRRRHTLTSRQGSGNARQTFSLDLGPGLRPASGVFHKSDGSLLTFAFPTPITSRGALVVACHLRLGGAVVATSALIRLWDERPARNALLDSQSDAGLPCRRWQRQPNLGKLIALDCELLPSTSPSATSMLLETAVYALHSCRNKATAASLTMQSNSTDPTAFYAVFFAGHLRLGWTITGDWNSSDLCVSADAPLPSRRQRLHLRWRLRIEAESNSTDAGESVFVPDRSSTDPAIVSIDPFDDPPVARALPCPFLCPAAQAGTPVCKFSWLQSRNASSWPEALQSPDPALGSLAEPHRLLLLPWKPPGNPGPPPLAGLYTCRSLASLAAASSTPAQQFRVRVVARPSLCGNRPPSRSVVFVPPPGSSDAWSVRQTFALNCTICGLDSSSEASVASTDTHLRLHGSLGGVEASAESLSQTLPGGGVELSLRFTQFRLDEKHKAGGSVLVQCRSVDALGRGLVAFAAIEALQAPSRAICEADCPGRSEKCRRFRCPMEPSLATALPTLGVSVAFLFTIQPYGGTPPQQTLSSADRLETWESVTRLRCTQLLYYSDDNGLDEDISGSRRQRFVVADAASAASYRAALGERRYSRLLLAVESGWLELPVGGWLQSDAVVSSANPDSSSYRGLSKTAKIFLIITVVLCCLVAVFLVLAHSFRNKVGYNFRAWLSKFTHGRMDAKTAACDQNEQASQKQHELGDKDQGKKNQAPLPRMSTKQQLVEGAPREQFDAKNATNDEASSTKEVTETHNSASLVHHALLFQMPKRPPPLQQPALSPRLRQQVMGLLSTSSSTRATPTSPTVTLLQTLKPSGEIESSDSGGDAVGSFVTLSGGGSPAVMSWPLSQESKVRHIDAVILSTTESSAKHSSEESPCISRYRLCPPAETVASSARVCDHQLSSTDIVADMVLGIGVAAESSNAAVSAAGPASRADRRCPAVHIRVRDYPEFLTDTGTNDAIDDVAESDEAFASNFVGCFPSPQAAETLQPLHSDAAYSADLARLARCLVCQPPRVNLAPSSAIGVEISIIGSTSTSTGSTSSTTNSSHKNCGNCDTSRSCSKRCSPDAVEAKIELFGSASEEVEIPSSDLQPTPLASTARGVDGSILFATASTAVVEVAESTLACASHQQRQQEDGSEDACSTCTCTGTCCSTESNEALNEPVMPLQVGLNLASNRNATPEPTNSDVSSEQMHLVRQAVNSAIERLNWE